MSRLMFMAGAAVAILAGVTAPAARATDADPCTGFKWDVSRELAVMRQAPQAITAARKPGANLAQIKVGTLYALQLAAQAAVTFVTSPAKSHPSDGATADLVRLRVDQAGRYRVSITSGHWVDIVDGGVLLKSLGFQGHTGCERPRKIVEFDLAADRGLILQLSGATDAEVGMAVTAVSAAAAN